MTEHRQRRLFDEARRLERELRARRIPAIEIPGILGAAFLASLTNLPPGDRAQAIGAHLVALRLMYGELRAAALAPDGDLAGL